MMAWVLVVLYATGGLMGQSVNGTLAIPFQTEELCHTAKKGIAGASWSECFVPDGHNGLGVIGKSPLQLQGPTNGALPIAPPMPRHPKEGQIARFVYTDGKWIETP